MAGAQAAAREAQRNAQSMPSAQPPPPPQTDAKPATDVLAGAMARAASQSTIHPLDTLKVRMQSQQTGSQGTAAASARAGSVSGARAPLHSRKHEILGLYKGVGGAATCAGLAIGAYFFFYTKAKRLLRQHTELNEGAVAFVAGGAAAAGSCVVKVPMAVCVRSVQAGVYQSPLEAIRTITKAAGIRGLFTGFAPTLLEDVPDSAIKFAAYESLRSLHGRIVGRNGTTLEDLLMGTLAGSLAAAVTTPLDVVKTVMMCSASQRPTFIGAARTILAERQGVAPFFRGVGPRALCNGLNSGIFFCFFEALRQLITKHQHQRQLLQMQQIQSNSSSSGSRRMWKRPARKQQAAAACLTLALPMHGQRLQ